MAENSFLDRQFNGTGRMPEEDSWQESYKKNRAFFVVGVIILSIVAFFLFKGGLILGKIFGGKNSTYLDLVKNDPTKDPNRINILILGLRGEGDTHGGLLTDAVMILSLKKDTGQTALISIPRDLYIDMPSIDSRKATQKEKINFAYALGRERAGERGGLAYSKAAVSEITNLYLDYAIVIDFIAFKKIVDLIGGIQVYLNAPFTETAQFDQEFIINLPAGQNFLDGTTALYYVRSRFSSSDFDRARRQQDVLLAIKNKALPAGILANPVKVYNLVEILGSHLRTDMTMDNIGNLLGLYQKFDFDKIKKRVFDTSLDGLLYSGYNDAGAYVLLPVGGNFDKIQKACREIFQ